MVLGPSGEPIGTGGSLGNPGDNYGRFQQAYQRQGFMSSMRSFGSGLSNISKLNDDISKLVGSNGTIAKLQQALEGLTARLNATAMGASGGPPAAFSSRGLPTGINGGGSTFTIGQTPWQSGATTSPQGTPASGTGGDSGGGGGVNPHTRGMAYIGAATFAVGGVSNMLDTRMQRSIDLAPSATSLQMPSGATYRQVNQALANRTLTYGTQGGQDTLSAAAQAQALAGRPMLNANGTMNPVFRQTMGNISQIALTSPGMSMTEASQVYAQLRSPEVNWWGVGMRLPTFTGPGRTSPSFSGTATQYLQRLLPNATAAQRNDPAYMYGQFQQGMPGYAAGVQFLGGDQQLQAVVNAGLANMQYRKATGGRQGDIFGDIQQDTTGRYINRQTGQYTNAGWRQYEREARLGGYSNEVIAQTRNLQNLDSKNTMLFSASQETNIARSLAVQISIRDNVEKIARKIGALGPAASAANSALSAITGNPIVDVLLGAVLRGGGIGGGAAGGATAGAETAAGTAEAGTTAGVGLGTAGIFGASIGSIPILPAIGAALLGQMTKTKIHNMSKGKGFWGGFGKALYYGTGASLSDAAFSDVSKLGMGVAHGVQGLGNFLLGDPPVKGGFFHPIAGAGVGDPSQDDISLLESRSNTGHADSVTNLNPSFRAEVARMFRDNPNLRLNSGWRSIQEQQVIWDRNGHNPNVAAPPGSSMHEKGLAVDVGPSSQYSWLHTHGGIYGLVNYEPEPWHWEPAGASNAGNRSNYGVMPDAKAGKVAATGTTGTQAAASTATSSTAISGGRSFGGFSGMSQGALMQSLIGSGTQLGLISFTGATSFGGDTTSTASTSGADAAASSSGGGGGKVGNVGNIKTALDFAHALEKAEGWPQSASNDSVLVAWQKAEGLVSASYFNPLNTTQKESGATYGGGAVGHYKDWTMGVQATVDALNSGNGQWYAAIRNGFAQSMDPHQLARIISGSQWAGGHYNDNPPGSTGGTIAQNLANVGDPPATARMGMSGSGSFLRNMRGIGDAPVAVRAPIMASVTSMAGGHRLPVQATFNVNVQNASQNEAEQFAQYAWKRLKQLDEEEARRTV